MTSESINNFVLIYKKLEEDEFNEHLVFSDEAIFHTNGKVNKHNVCIWVEENPHATIEHERDSPKVNVFYAISKNHVHGPFSLRKM